MPDYDLFTDPETGEKLIKKDGKTLVASGRSAEYPIIDGIPRFVSKDLYEGCENESCPGEVQTASSFGKKWGENSFKKLGMENEFEKKSLKEQFMAMLGCSTENDLYDLLAGAERTLNGGCGVAWSEYLFNYNPRTQRHCVDLSLAVEAAYENTKHMPNITVSQASILELPYPEDIFDIVYSDGVVHHTPDPERAVRELGRRVKHGGILGIYIYNKKPFIRELVDHAIREKTTKMSYEACYEFSREMTLLGKAFQEASAKPLVIEKDIPLIDIRAGTYDLQNFIYNHFIKCWYNPGATSDYADLVNQDWYHPAYASHHNKEDVFRWFEETGFEDLKCIQPEGWDHSGYFISGIRRHMQV